MSAPAGDGGARRSSASAIRESVALSSSSIVIQGPCPTQNRAEKGATISPRPCVAKPPRVVIVRALFGDRKEKTRSRDDVHLGSMGAGRRRRRFGLHCPALPAGPHLHRLLLPADSAAAEQ